MIFVYFYPAASRRKTLFFYPAGGGFHFALTRQILDFQSISDHQQSWGYEDGPWKWPGPPLLVAADLSQFINRRHRSGLHPSSMPSR
jgi:hypothetical protein